jgi:hypothetical protein
LPGIHDGQGLFGLSAQRQERHPVACAFLANRPKTGAIQSAIQITRRADCSPSPPRSGGEGQGEVVLRVQGEDRFGFLPFTRNKIILLTDTSNRTHRRPASCRKSIRCLIHRAMSATEIIKKIKDLSPSEQVEVIQFALKLARTRPLTANELTELTKCMMDTDAPAEAERLKTSIARGFYGE